MDVSGVEVDSLNDEEILELCSDIVDCSSDEISVLQEVNINNLSDDKTQKLYEDTMYGTEALFLTQMPLTDEQVLRNSYNTVDTDSSEILLRNGQNIDFDKLTDDEIADLYNDVLDDNGILIAATKGSYSCTLSSSNYKDVAHVDTYAQYATWYCNNVTLDGKTNYSGSLTWTVGSYPYVWIPRFSTTTLYFKCTGYLTATNYFCGTSTYKTFSYTYGYCHAPASHTWDASWNVCK